MAGKTSTSGFTAEERAAMKERAKEVRKGRGKTDGEADVLEKIAELSGPDKEMAERIHALVKESAPTLTSRTWYGMPAYAAGDKVICYFQPARKFKERYATFGFNAAAKLDDGPMWATSFAVTDLTPEVEERIAALVKRAVG